MTERPDQPIKPRLFSRRRILTWFGLGAATAVGGRELVKSQLPALMGKNIYNYFDGHPQYENSKLVTKNIYYSFEAMKRRAMVEVGDSLSAGLTEEDPDRRFGYQHQSPSVLIYDWINYGYKKKDPSFGWALAQRAKEGKTIGEIIPQLHNVKDFKIFLDQAGPADVDLSAGGNDFMNFMTDTNKKYGKNKIAREDVIRFPLLHMDALPELIQDFENFLVELSINFATLLRETINLRKHHNLPIESIFALGLPNLEDITPSEGVGDFLSIEGTDFLQLGFRSKMLKNFALRINATMVNVMEHMQQTHPEIQMVFENIIDKNIPLYGIHPTKEGYAMIAKNRLSRYVSDFPTGTHSFLQELQQQGIIN